MPFHLGQKPAKYRVDCLIHSVSGLPVDEKAALSCVVRKSNKANSGVQTRQVKADEKGKVCWFDTLSYNCTVYSDPNTGQTHPKLFDVVVQSDGEKRVREVWTSQFNISDFVNSKEVCELALERVAPGRFSSPFSKTSHRRNSGGLKKYSTNGEASKTPFLKLTLEAVWQKDITASEVDEQSMMTPSMDRRFVNSDAEGPMRREIKYCGEDVHIVEEGLDDKENQQKGEIETQISRSETSLEERRRSELLLEDEIEGTTQTLVSTCLEDVESVQSVPEGNILTSVSLNKENITERRVGVVPTQTDITSRVVREERERIQDEAVRKLPHDDDKHSTRDQQSKFIRIFVCCK